MVGAHGARHARASCVGRCAQIGAARGAHDVLEIHKDAIEPGDKVIIVDDLLATGGTAAAVEKIVKQLGGNLVGFEFLIELDSLNGRKNLECQNINVQIHY